MTHRMEFRILGPVETRVDGEQRLLNGAKPRTVLVEFLLAHGRVVSDERLTDLLWAEAAPATASAQIYTYASRLRKLFEPSLQITRYPHGYSMKLGDAWCDHLEFSRLSSAGLDAVKQARWRTATDLLSRALSLWRGPVLVDVTDHMAATERPRLEEARLRVLEGRVAADLMLGRHHDLVAELTWLVAEQPLRERLRAQLMTALYRCDRQADAIATYQEGRHVLADGYGVDPGPVLSATYQAILTGNLRLPASETDSDGRTGECRRSQAAAGCVRASRAPRLATRPRSDYGRRSAP
ncbi:AfsR/SARP family transcriptional regulator [Microbispora bryophytorum]|uniref:AfsR/SARP family transcriptional regulator n=1 Tax=Microbispora bryophytorum TaxID=1460882 RepID=UPI0033CB1A31